MNIGTIRVKYNKNNYPFRDVIEGVLGLSNLENAEGMPGMLKRETDQSTDYHKMYYNNFALFMPLYERFINEPVKALIGEDIVYQAIPTFRFHGVGNVSVGEFHKDRKYGHNESAINFFLPFTNAYDTSAIWIESQPDKGDYAPINTRYGEVTIFDGIHLTHGNKVNKTGANRISVDFRVIPLSKYKEEEGAESINMKMKFKIGEYYKCTK